MNTKFFQDHFEKLNFNLDNKIIKKFTPIISQDFEKDKVNFHLFGKSVKMKTKK